VLGINKNETINFLVVVKEAAAGFGAMKEENAVLC
jgi:hypothetical protein